MSAAKPKISIHGKDGRMGRELQKLVEKTYDLKDADLILDFSSPEGCKALLDACVKANLANKAILIGSTGLTSDLVDKWQQYAKKKNCCVLLAPNTSMGIFLLTKICAQVGELLFDSGFDIEISETHHRMKEDAPSGTAQLLAAQLKNSISQKLKVETDRKGKRPRNSIGIQSFRGGNVFGEHNIRFLGDDEEITLSHRALSRALFAKGALVLGKWLLKQKQAKVYELDDIEWEELK